MSGPGDTTAAQRDRGVADDAAAARDREPAAPPTPDAGARKPTIVVDRLDVVYEVLATGKRATGSRRLLQRRTGRRGIREIHAVRDVSFVAREGEAIGLIGVNGSGKSTLLRAIAGLLPVRSGRVWAEAEPTLLGVNAALINELSGERNVVLGGLAMGMSPAEVTRRYPDIVDFAAIGEFIDLPMSTYSAGMGARLRFAIASSAAHRILLIDEALATGDAVFQRKSQDRIDELRATAGTVFVVSHSLGIVRESCERALWLDQGRLRMDGPSREVVDAYEAATGRR